MSSTTADIISRMLTDRETATKNAQDLATHWQAVADQQRKELEALARIVGTETPIGALDLAATWSAEKQFYMEQLEETRLEMGAAYAAHRLAERRVAELRQEAAGLSRAYGALHRAARAVVANTTDADALRELARCVASNSAGVEETREG